MLIRYSDPFVKCIVFFISLPQALTSKERVQKRYIKSKCVYNSRKNRVRVNMVVDISKNLEGVWECHEPNTGNNK